MYASEWVCVFWFFFLVAFAMKNDTWNEKLHWKFSKLRENESKKNYSRIISPRLVANKNGGFPTGHRKKITTSTTNDTYTVINGEEKLMNAQNIDKKNLEAKIRYWKLWTNEKIEDCTVKNSEHTNYNEMRLIWFCVEWIDLFFFGWFGVVKIDLLLCEMAAVWDQSHFVSAIVALTYPNKRRFGTLYVKHNNNKNNYN